MTSASIRVVAVDDHAFLVEGLKARLDVEPDMEVVGHLANANTLVEDVKRLKPDILLLDIEMPGTDSFEALADLNRQAPDVRVIMLSAFVRDHYIDAAYAAGAWGYLSKRDSSDVVIDGIRAVARGESVSSAEVLERSQSSSGGGRKKSASRRSLLTSREEQILRMIAKGMTRTEIAEALSRSPMTVDNHRKSIMKKLGISDRVELARYAIGEGLVEV